MNGENFPDLLSLLINVAKVAPPLIELFQLGALIVSLWYTLMGFLTLYSVNRGSASRFMAGKSQSTFTLAFSYLTVGALMSMFYRLDLVGVFNLTLSGGHVATPINSVDLQYDAGGNTTERLRIATTAILSILQFIGVAAMMRGVMMIHHNNAGLQNASIGKSLIVIISGAVAFDFNYFLNVVNNQLGYDFIGLFSPFR